MTSARKHRRTGGSSGSTRPAVFLDYEQILLDGMFVKATTDSKVRSVQLSEPGSRSALQLKRARQGLYADVAKRGWFTARPDRVRRKWRVIGLAMVVAGVAAVIVAAAGTHHLGLVPIPVALAGLVLIAGARWMPVRTAQGTALARRVEGFRRYIKTAAVAQAHPAGQPDMLYDCLPYAIAFGCTKEWADLTGSLTHTGQPPSWYRIRAPFTAGSLSSLPQSGYYLSSMISFTAALHHWVASSPSSSGSGYGGGFSGGHAAAAAEEEAEEEEVEAAAEADHGDRIAGLSWRPGRPASANRAS